MITAKLDTPRKHVPPLRLQQIDFFDVLRIVRSWVHENFHASRVRQLLLNQDGIEPAKIRATIGARGSVNNTHSEVRDSALNGMKTGGIGEYLVRASDLANAEVSLYCLHDEKQLTTRVDEMVRIQVSDGDTATDDPLDLQL